MDNKKILLLDLSKGKVGEDNSALLGAMIITKLQLAALSRVDIPEDQRQDFYLYVDEFQNFVTDSFATILSEARKYRLNLTIGHQYMGQLMPDHSNTKVRDAVFGNVGTMVIFRVGSADAEYLETEFDPIFTPNDIVNLPKAHIILKLMINGVASEPFSAVTLPPISDGFSGNKDKVIRVSRERHANPAAEVEEKIGRWMGSDFNDQPAQSASGQPATNSTPASSANNGAPSRPYQRPATSAQSMSSPSVPTISSAPTSRPITQPRPNSYIPRTPAPVTPKTIPEDPFKPSMVQPKPKAIIASPVQTPTSLPRHSAPPSNGGNISFSPQATQSFQKPVVSKPELQKSEPVTSPSPSRHETNNSETSSKVNIAPKPIYKKPIPIARPPISKAKPLAPKPPAKPSNPIWDTASELDSEKSNKLADDFAAAIGSAFNSTPNNPPLDNTNKQNDKAKVPNSPGNTVMHPGQVHKF